LIGQPQQIRGIRPGGLQPCRALAGNALATWSTLGAVVPTIGCCRGMSYNPRAARRIVPDAAMRDNALSTACRVPRSRKSDAEKTHPSPRALTRASIARSVGLATFIDNLLSEICMRFSDNRQARNSQILTSAGCNQTLKRFGGHR
jgi:hypothetical protein